ncbi:transcription-repair coupling factor [Gammaproteobacteria bacterium]|nr:transcription-repair coupling factor [Gammaproteobacteria bacterium]MDA9799735.1 transcription-repair coupling factor [Gammaproteobacteria bacterium]
MSEKQHEPIALELAQSVKRNNKQILYLCDSDKEARLLKNELKLFVDDNLIGYYPEREILPYDRFSTADSIVQERINLLNSDKSNFKIIITSCINLFEKLPSKDFFVARKKYKIYDSLSIKDLTLSLEALNYERTDKVDAINQYTVRGGVVDFYSGFQLQPIRVDFFGDQIDDIREFDPSSQNMTNKLSEFQLFSGSEVQLDEESIGRFKYAWRNYFQSYDERHCEIFQSLASGKYLEGYEIYNPLIQSGNSNLVDYFTEFSLIKPNKIDQILTSYLAFVEERYLEESIDSSRPILKPKDYIFEFEDLQVYLKSADQMSLSDAKLTIDHSKEKNIQLKMLIDKQVNGIIDTLLVTSSEQTKLDQINKQYRASITSLPFILKNGIFSCMHLPVRSFISTNGKFVHLNLDEILNSEILSPTSTSANQDSLIENFENPFQDDELVIHVDYGVGIYKGLELLKTNSSEEEYIRIEYLENEILYVPIRQAYLVSKFQVSQTHGVRLDSLSSAKWKLKKEKAKIKARDHAAELLDIESRRSVATSYQLICEQSSYQEFDKDFPYVLTSDQVNCIKDILKDMALVKPMNRVICGDVGFGKTEVAMRGAFVGVHAKKQVMVLAPSTVLAKQHLESFTKRFVNFPVNIELLTRHTSLKNKSKIYDDFKHRKIDILIGTHALLNNDISLENLGLLIIDEEHRFGIKQKEIIKSRQSTTHILYMSATPIPRTLNLVYSGLKDFSYLYTPPLERLSVRTFLNTQNQQIIKNAIDRELARGGQVFLVQNNISKMEGLKNQIKNLVPEANIDIAHGKLSKKDITNTMNGFNSNSIDILICTTIVEMGLDIPNANTIIVIDAHNFGLSQLHQLRGRVGRSMRQAYCYLLIPTQDLKKAPQAKLDSLVKYSDLGSGYFIAQEDLEIRGAGDFLGVKQSGHIEAIGLSMYLSMLKSAVNDLKGHKPDKILDTEINFNDRALIPDTYLPVANERLKIYRSLNDARSDEEIDKILEELKDRCGKPNDDLLNLIESSKLRILANKVGIKKIYSNLENAMITFNNNLSDQVYKKLIGLIQTGSAKIKLDKENKITLDVSKNNNKRIAVAGLLNELV